VAVVNLNITPVNDPPVANDDMATTPEDTPVLICVPDNDTDVDGNLDLSSVTILTPPAHGMLSIDPVTGCVTYTPDLNYNGPDVFTYQICDTGLPVACDPATVNIMVTPINDLPNAINDGVFTLTEDSPTTNLDVLVNDAFGGDGPSNGPILMFTSPSHGTAVVNNGGTPLDPTDDTIDYTPDPNYTGPDQFTYQICDSNGDCDVAVVNLTINPVNDPPVANDDMATTPEDTPVTFSLTANDTDLDGNIDPATIDLDPIVPGQQTSYTIAGQGT